MQTLPKSGVNIISPELKALIPKFKPGEIKSFQAMWGVTNNQPHISSDPRNAQKRLYGHKQIPTNDRIKDLNGEYVQIGVPETWVPDTQQVTKWKSFIPGLYEQHFGGVFTLHEGNIEHEELYEYLFLCSYNKNSPCRNTKIEPMFFEITKDIIVGADNDVTPVRIKRKVQEPEKEAV